MQRPLAYRSPPAVPATPSVLATGARCRIQTRDHMSPSGSARRQPATPLLKGRLGRSFDSSWRILRVNSLNLARQFFESFASFLCMPSAVSSLLVDILMRRYMLSQRMPAYTRFNTETCSACPHTYVLDERGSPPIQAHAHAHPSTPMHRGRNVARRAHAFAHMQPSEHILARCNGAHMLASFPATLARNKGAHIRGCLV